jgi:hypothetical protein
MTTLGYDRDQMAAQLPLFGDLALSPRADYITAVLANVIARRRSCI